MRREMQHNSKQGRQFSAMNHEIRLNLFCGPFKLISYKMYLHANLQSPRTYEYCLSPGFVIHYFISLHYGCAVELDCSFDPVLFFILKFIYIIFCFLYGEGRPRLDLEYPVYGAHELADERAFASMVVLTACFPSGFCRDLNPRREGRRVPSGEGW